MTAVISPNPKSAKPSLKSESACCENNDTVSRTFLKQRLTASIKHGLQAVAVLTVEFLFIVLPFVFLLLWLFLLLTHFYWVSLGYGTWLLYDVYILKTSSRGGRRREWLRDLKFWQYASDYFPLSMEKTTDLDPTKNYILGYHPHGALALGPVISFVSNATGFREKFPGIVPYPLGLKSRFHLPVHREFLLWNGICDVSRESIQWILTRQGQGNAVMVVVGGAEEALEAHPGSYNITLLSRKGFVKQAIRTGACLVPMFSFGENDMFNQLANPRGSTVRYYQEKIKDMIGICLPLIHGRGFCPLPYRHRASLIVGRPIDVHQCDEPDMETINRVHKQYMDGLSQLFDAHKGKYGVTPEKKLNFV